MAQSKSESWLSLWNVSLDLPNGYHLARRQHRIAKRAWQLGGFTVLISDFNVRNASVWVGADDRARQWAQTSTAL
jgi:hypothetical protein